ncbi:hypothetical protein ACHAWX_000097 [Stephanocyclus meneghinianus]
MRSASTKSLLISSFSSPLSSI